MWQAVWEQNDGNDSEIVLFDTPCRNDFDADGDVDAADLSALLCNSSQIINEEESGDQDSFGNDAGAVPALRLFVTDFGRSRCPDSL